MQHLKNWLSGNSDLALAVRWLLFAFVLYLLTRWWIDVEATQCCSICSCTSSGLL